MRHLGARGVHFGVAATAVVALASLGCGGAKAGAPAASPSSSSDAPRAPVASASARGGGPPATSGAGQAGVARPPMSIEALGTDAPIAPRLRPHVLPTPRGRLGPSTAPSELPVPEAHDDEDQGLPPSTKDAPPRPGDE